MTRPTLPQLDAQIGHVEASILGIEDANRIRVQREKDGKRTDGMGPARELRLNGLRDVRVTLGWLREKLGERA